MQTRFCLPFSLVVFFFHKLLQCYNFGSPGTISHVGFLLWEVTVLYGNFMLIMVMSVFTITSKYGSQAPEEKHLCYGP